MGDWNKYCEYNVEDSSQVHLLRSCLESFLKESVVNLREWSKAVIDLLVTSNQNHLLIVEFTFNVWNFDHYNNSGDDVEKQTAWSKFSLAGQRNTR